MPQKLPPIIADLIERFEQNAEAFRSAAYNETQVRLEFINPFFEALGWDMANKAGHAEAYKDVIHEDAIKVGAPDYCFRIGGARKFFLEAKKPAVNIKDDPDPAYQLRRYAWSAKLPLSILTDFEEFAVYDCRARPSPSDKASAGRTLYLTYRDYATHWDQIASIFSKDAVLKGSFDKYAVSERKRGTTTVDAEFLAEIEKWREDLAKNLAVRNTALDVHELNFAVQRTIDRLIFLRICEDRGIEPYAQLQALLNGEHIYGRLRHLYDQADDRYNSGLFHFRSEKERAETPDELTPKLKIDDKVLKDIIHGLYYPESPYEFSVMPAEILGQVYEQFLGKVIRLTSGHQAKVEEKPEVKKAGGVYYTPAYIVEYIVRNTVGKLCEDKTPKQIAGVGARHAVPLRILDPACGSGSFLIGAYDYLVAYHRDWYLKDGAEKHTKELYQGAGGLWHLTTQEKKRILLNNIYGVDIDSQAVEVTKLSLLLKVLEGENEETLKRQLRMWHERALPDLGRNIKCGNSLIGPDYFSGQLIPDEDEMHRVNPFDWSAEFQEIMKAGGFDAVIGNPPYGYMIPQPQQEYFSHHYRYQDYQKDLYLLFLERYEHFLASKGLLGVIVSNTWLQSVTLRKIRQYLTAHYCWLRILLLPDKVFRAVVDTHVLIFQRDNFASAEAGSLTVDVRRGIEVRLAHRLPWQAIPRTGDPINVAAPIEVHKLFQKIQNNSSQLLKFCDVYNGVKPFEEGKGNPPQTKQIMKDKPYVREGPAPDKKWSPLLRGSLIHRYTNLWNRDSWVLYGSWLAAPRDPSIFKAPVKIMVRQTGDSIIAVLVEGGFIGRDNLHILLPRDEDYDLRYTLGIMNSKLMDFAYTMMNPEKGEALAQVKKYHVEQLPIRPINFSDNADKAKHDKMVALVERMMNLHERLATAKAPDDKTKLQRQIDATDKEIDRLVYNLYGLTEEEIRIVEGTSVASGAVECENTNYEDASSSSRHEKSGRQAAPVAKAVRHAGESGGGAPQGASGSRGPVHGVRERTSEYGSLEDSPERAEGEAERLGSTRYFETAEGVLSYAQVSERLAVSLAGILQEILLAAPEQITITPEWLCRRHQALAGDLFPEWAGRFRDVNVQVGSHTPPPFYEVPVLMRLFCDDLTERLRHIRPRESEAGVIAELLAWADGRFQGIHPFKDFNGRIGRVLLATILYKLALPHAETAPLDAEARRQYLGALHAADNGDLGLLTELWARRIAESL